MNAWINEQINRSIEESNDPTYCYDLSLSNGRKSHVNAGTCRLGVIVYTDLLEWDKSSRPSNILAS